MTRYSIDPILAPNTPLASYLVSPLSGMKLEEVSVEGGGRALLVRLGFARGGEDEDANGTPTQPLTEGLGNAGECCVTVTFCMQID